MFDQGYLIGFARRAVALRPVLSSAPHRFSNAILSLFLEPTRLAHTVAHQVSRLCLCCEGGAERRSCVLRRRSSAPSIDAR